MITQRKSRSGGRWVAPLFLAAMIGIAGCDFLDPTKVENPRTTADDLANAQEPTRALLPGLRAQFARLIAANTVVSEVVSDNFSIHGTGLFKEWDSPRDVTPTVANSTGTSTGNYWNAQELRALASFVIDEIAPGDETAAAEDVAEAHYYRGMAYLLLAENFSYAPLARDEAPVPATQLLTFAVQDLQAATGAGGEVATAAQAGLARAYRWQGDAASAAAAANAVLGADATFLFLQEYDASSIDNSPFAFLVLRALQEMQPLPRLDFLDPKYLDREQGIAVAKAEEMHLILAEIALAGGNLPGARDALGAAIDLAQSRTTTSFFDEDPRLNADLSVRPRSSAIEIRADANSPYISGLVLDRPGNTTQRVVSGTSVAAADVADMSADELWYAFHLVRQEILFLEGRRMADLGIRLPMMLREIDANSAIDPGDPGTLAFVPAYIPPADQMDLFTPASPYDGNGNLVTNQVTMTVDMNRILADNLVTPF
ncbi:MAG: hypothetical protein JSU98_08410 [Gemmatimonadales bacterium]|nr:MAG: hypothetical protein JSU98_08410 [Gemmatimonadales bacterium]